MKVVRCADSHRDAWNDYIARTADASFYHRFEWQYVNRRCFGHDSCYLAAVDSGDRIVGILPIVHLKSHLFGNVACSLPFVNYGGPCAADVETEHALLDEAARVAAEWQVAYVEIRSRKNLGTEFPSSSHKVSMTVDLSSGVDGMWKAFKTSHRQDIRGGYKKGFTARLGGFELFDDLFSVLAEAWRNLGTPIYSKGYLETVSAMFPAQVRLCVVYLEGEPVAGSFQAYDRGIAEGLWLGSRARQRHQYAGYVLYWEILQDAFLHGCTRFHLGRSTANSGAETFKKKWNAVATQLYWQYILRTRHEIPQVNVNNPKYKVAMNIWRRLPVNVTTRVGPMLAKNIP